MKKGLVCLFLLLFWVSASRGEVKSVVVEQLGSSAVVVRCEGVQELGLVEREGDQWQVTFFEEGTPSVSHKAPLVRRAKAESGKDRVTVELSFHQPMGSPTQRALEEGVELVFRAASARSFARPTQLEGAVSLELKEAPLAGALELVASQRGLNLLAQGVPDRKVTLSLRDAPASTTLSALLGGTGLSWGVAGKTLIVAPKGELRSALGQSSFASFDLYHSDAKEVARVVGEVLGEDGTVSFDERTRQIFVTGDASALSRAQALITRLDRAKSQIAIKARIIEVSDSATKEVENLLAALYKEFFFSLDRGFATLGLGSLLEKPSWSNKAEKAFDLRLGGLVGQGKARLLADPTVVVLDGEEATIKLVDRVRYITGRDEGKNPTTTDEEVGPQLTVRPTWDGEESVTVELELKTGEITQWKKGGQGEELPQVSERQVRTRVRVPSGVPFVVGGLFKETTSHFENKTPLLGDLPLVGGLFRSVSIKTQKGQVIMILTPYLLGP